jgi:Ca-activated chloride channel family protein
VIILLTDGVNNAGFIEPETAADIAKQYGIKVYTIGIGTKWQVSIRGWTKWSVLFQMMKVEIDEQLMKSIAKKTDGRYFRATSNNANWLKYMAK